ncbi:alpha/beta hydrolase [Streptacidiphilus sp. N1-12]|uniref:Alpha/beta hydrolase n=2 Tax=Streptacidiphilus alkalitolerans TaxID=3342712 RepID=A0ABV6VBU9_9ACTN
MNTRVAAADPALSPGVRRITLDGAGVRLSALLCEPPGTGPEAPPRATVVALHGAGMNAGYFDGQAAPDISLLALGAKLGFTVLAVDRPGYGRSAAQLAEGQSLAEQAVTLAAALRDFGARFPTGAGLFLLAHSFGGKLALLTAANQDRPELLGLDISGCGHRYAPGAHADSNSQREWKRSWGPLRLYPPDTFRSSGGIVAPTPARERRDILRWPAMFSAAADRVRVPVRFTFAEHESWWCDDRDALAELASHLTSSPRVLMERQPGAGHNISLGLAARSYHLSCLGFFEDCLLRLAVAVPS